MNNSNLALSFYQSQLNNSQLRPFSFQLPQNEQFNHILLENIDLEHVKATGDLNTCAPLIRNFVSCKFTPDSINDLPYEDFTKLLKVSQLSMDYYMQNQEHQEKIIADKLESLQKAQEKLSKLKEIEKNHQLQSDKLKREMEDLKKDYLKAKEESLQSVIYKCHFCHKNFKSKEFLTQHINKNHDPKSNTGQSLAQISKPEYLTNLLEQLQQQQAQLAQQQVNPNQQVNMAATGQSWALSNVNVLGSRGFEELQKRQDDKLKQKEERRRQRQAKREQERIEKAKRFQVQTQMMKAMEQNIQGLMENKISEVRNLQESMVQEQLQLKLGNQQLMAQLQSKQFVYDPNQIQQVLPIDKSQISQKQVITNVSQIPSDNENILVEKSRDDEFNTLEGELQRMDNSEQDISKDLPRYGVNQRKMTAQPINNDQSGVMSFHNYSYSNQSQGGLPIKTNQQENQQAFTKSKQQLAKNQADMAHIGELESDNEQDEEHNNQDGTYLRPLNKKSEVKKAEVDYLQSIYHKERTTPYDEGFDYEHELDMDNLIENERRRQGVPDEDDLKAKDLKEIQGLLQKVKGTNVI